MDAVKNEVVETILKNLGYEKLWPWQEDAINKIMTSSKNFLIKAPTGSGKTLVAYVTILEHLKKGDKVIYAVPSRALVSEKNRELKRALGSGFVIKTIGQQDTIKIANVLVGTFEQIFTLLIHNKYLLDSLGLVVLDDFHILYDRERGARLEKLISLLLYSNVRILALSATIKPLQFLAEWLNAEVIKYDEDKRPIKLDYKFSHMEKKRFLDFLIRKQKELSPAIIFCRSRARAKTLCKEYVEMLEKKSAQPRLEEFLKNKRISRTKQKFIEDVLEDLETRFVEITSEIEDLARCIQYGASWHHAGLSYSVREYVEKLFREGFIDYIFTTTTLAHGVNTPAKAVVIYEPYRWTPDRGSQLIPVYEWLQMAGRAGRAGYSMGSVGYVWTITGSSSLLEKARIQYKEDNIEEAVSHLGTHKDILALTILQLIEAGYNSDDKLMGILKRTLWYHEKVNKVPKLLKEQIQKEGKAEKAIFEELEKIASSLYSMGWISYSGERYVSTELGRIIVRFYESTFSYYSLSEINNIIEDIKKWKGERPLSGYDAALIVLQNIERLRIYPPRDSEVDEKVKSKIIEGLANEGIHMDEIEYDNQRNALFSWFILKNAWSKGLTLSRIEEEYGEWATYINTVSPEIARFLEELVEPVCKAFMMPLAEEFKDQVKEIKYGLPWHVLPIMENVRGLGRVLVARLYGHIVSSVGGWVSSPLGEYLIGILREQGFVKMLQEMYNQLGENEFSKLVQEVKGFGDARTRAIVNFVKEVS